MKCKFKKKNYFCTMKNAKVIILIFFGLLTITGCHKKQIMDKPERLIPYDKLINIIVDSYLIESYVYMAPADSDKIEMTKALYYDMFTRYKVTKEEFISSIDYYFGDEDLANKMMAEASKRFAEKRKLFFQDKDKMEEQKNQLQDSAIKKIPF